MLKRILVGLDGSEHSKAATKYALDLAKRHGSRVSGVAVVDESEIARRQVGVNIGSAYYASHLREALKKQWVERTAGFVKEFSETARAAGVPFTTFSEAGVPFEAIVADARYHDLVVVGLKTYFHGPEEEEHGRRDTLLRLTYNAIRPVLMVPAASKPVKKVLLAVGSGSPSARAINAYLHLQPWPGAKLVLLHIGDDESEGEFLLRAYSEYAEAHGVASESVLLADGEVGETVLKETESRGCHAIVMGAHDQSTVKEMLFGSSTTEVFENSTVPVMLHA